MRLGLEEVEHGDSTHSTVVIDDLTFTVDLGKDSSS